MSRWELIGDERAGAADGLATDEALLLGHGRGARCEHAATLRLYTYRPHCALIGRFQSLEDEVDSAAAARLGVQVARRPTGGGAIIMGPGQLGVALATRAPAERSPRELLAAYGEALAAGLARLGADARFAGKNDLLLDGRKVAGLGLYLDADGALLFHASVLVELDVELMLAVLRIPGADPRRVRERIATLDRPLPEVSSAIAAGLAERFGATLEPAALGPDRARRRDELIRDRYAHEGWTGQRSALRDAHASETLKTPEGLVRVHVATHGQTIKRALVSGSFNALPAGVARLEGALRWAPATPEQIAARTAAHVGHDDLGVAPAALADALWAATERALAGAHPHRPSGSCYFPEGLPA